MFVWRLRHESLVVCANLMRRGLKLDQSKCFFCGRAEEDGAHLFIKCKHVKQAWRELGMEEERSRLEEFTSVHAMLDALWGFSEKKRVLVITLWWQWWNIRNEIREGELAPGVTETIRRVRCGALEYAERFVPKKKDRQEGKWRPPSADELKVNLGGAFIPGSSFCGWGAVIRDSTGHIIAARAGRHEQNADAFGAEIQAMAGAVALAADIGAVRVIFETNSQLLAEALDVRKTDSSPYAVVIEDIKLQLKLWFARHRYAHADEVRIP